MFSTIFRSLRSPNYRLFFIGQILSLTGTWISSTAQGWLIFRLTGSESWLGFINFAQQFPALIVALVTGVIADRFDKIKILLGTQFFSMIQSFALAYVVWGPNPNMSTIIMLAIFQGIITGFDMPARQSLTPLLVKNRADLSNAIALNATMFNSARLIGPVIAGAILSISNEAVCFFIDGLSFLAVLIALTKIKLVRAVDPTAKNISTEKPSFRNEFLEGIKASLGDREIRRLIMIIGCTGLFGITPVVLMPVIAKVTFGGDAKLLGILLGASGFGALSGSIVLASGAPEALPKLLKIASLSAAVGMLALSVTRSLPLTALLVSVMGMSILLVIASCSTLIQLGVDDRLRGRVSSVFTMTWLGSMPIGALMMGAVAEYCNVHTALLLSGAALSAMYLAISRRKFE